MQINESNRNGNWGTCIYRTENEETKEQEVDRIRNSERNSERKNNRNRKMDRISLAGTRTGS